MERSEYWNAGFDIRVTPSGLGPLNNTARMPGDHLEACATLILFKLGPGMVEVDLKVFRIGLCSMVEVNLKVFSIGL